MLLVFTKRYFKINICFKTLLFGLTLLSGSLMATPKTPPKPVHIVSEKVARKAALKEYSGKVNSSELEYEDGHWVYSFDIADTSGDGTVHEIQIEAASGKVVSQKIETPAQEQSEKQHEVSNPK